MKSKKLRALIKAKKEEARGLLDTDMKRAKELAEEIRGLKEDLAVAEEVEEDELRDLKNKSPKDEKREVNKEMEVRAAAKHVLGMKLSEEERALVKVSDNGALLPEGYINELMVLRKGFPSLKQYCHVIPVNTKTGKMPVATLGKNKLAKLTSNEAIPEGAMVTDKILYDIDDYGKFVPVENTLTDDEVVGLIQNILIPDFAEGGVASENEEIISILKENSVAVEGAKSYEDIEKAINGSLPATKAGLITVTNIKGYCYLKGLKDKEGRDLKLITEINGVEYFNSKPIITLDDEDVVPTTEGNLIFYVANLHELVKFFDRKTVEIAKSSEFLFNKNQDCLRAIERFDTVKGSARSAKKIEFALA